MTTDEIYNEFVRFEKALDKVLAEHKANPGKETEAAISNLVQPWLKGFLEKRGKK